MCTSPDFRNSEGGIKLFEGDLDVAQQLVATIPSSYRSTLRQYYLVGGVPNPLKNMKVNGKNYPIYIPYIMENKACSIPPTSYMIHEKSLHQWRFQKKGNSESIDEGFFQPGE